MDFQKPYIWHKKIIELKKEHNYTMKDLEKGIGTTESTINKWKNSEMKSSNLASAAIFFNTSSDYILGLSEDREISKRYSDLSDKQRELMNFIERLSLSETQFGIILKVIMNFIGFNKK